MEFHYLFNISINVLLSSESKMFARRVVLILKFFDFCGFFTEYSYSNRYQQVIYIVFILHIFFAVYFTFFLRCVLFSIRSLKLLDSINEFVQYQSSLHSYYILIIESFVHRKKQRFFWKIYKKIEDRSNFKCRLYSLKLIEFFVVLFVTNTICLYLSNIETHVWLGYTILNAINNIRLFYYIFYLELIRLELKCIEKTIKEMIELSRFSIVYYQHRNIYFKKIRDYYAITCELIDHLNEIFGLSNFSTMIYHFFYLFTILNYAYLHFDDYSIFYHVGERLEVFHYK